MNKINLTIYNINYKLILYFTLRWIIEYTVGFYISLYTGIIFT